METEDKLMKILTNEPSEPFKVGEYDVYVVFQRPPFKDKYKGRVWATKKIKEFGFSSPDEDPLISNFVRLWGTVNNSVTSVYYQDDKGRTTLDGKTYSEYKFDPSKDKDYGNVLEKYTVEEVYNKGQSDELFISEVVVAYTKWSNDGTLEEPELKNS